MTTRELTPLTRSKTVALWTLNVVLSCGVACGDETAGPSEPSGGKDGAGGTGRGGAGGEGESGRGDAGKAGEAESGRAGAGGDGRATGGTGDRGQTGGEAGTSVAGATSDGGSHDGGAGGASAECGNAVVESGEQCDDGNSRIEDGCIDCDVEQGWICENASPSVCRPRIVAIAAGVTHTCVALTTGEVRCWGQNHLDQTGHADWRNLGDDELPNSQGPIAVGGPVRQLSAGEGSTCALLTNGAVRCWGTSWSGALGYGNVATIGGTVKAGSAGDIDVGGFVEQIVSGHDHTCALLSNGAVRCWGGPGVTGYGTVSYIGDDETPASAGDVPIGGRVESLAAGAWHTCALLAGGMVRCWGLGDDGQLGYANKRSVGYDETPASAGNVEVGGIVVQIAAGGNHTCALLAAGTVRCWGYPYGGALGYGNLEHIGDDETPASVGDVPLGVRARYVVAGTNHTCVLTEDDAVRCWGSSWAGQTGYASQGDIGDDDLPSSVPDVNLGGAVELLDAGQEHTCALLRGSRLRCWGRGQEGELGYGNRDNIGDDEHPVSAGDVAYY